jgi:deoxyribodipyrimidine photo-lyase
MTDAQRVRALNRLDLRPGRYVLYWMQQAQRAVDNQALDYGIEEANRIGLPLIAVFGLSDRYPGANLRHYHFMVEGLIETARRLADRGVKLMILKQEPPQAALDLGRNAALIVTDRGYTRIQAQWRNTVAAQAECRVVEVDTDTVVPVAVASDHEEYGAYTLRPKLHRLYPAFLRPHKAATLARDSLALRPACEAARLPLDSRKILAALALDNSVEPVDLRAGYAAAREKLDVFCADMLTRYPEDSRNPNVNGLSGLSPYLHFGQISPLTIALRVALESGPGVDAFLEQLIVRRELAINFTVHNPAYDSMACLPDWAVATLQAHRHDTREPTYSCEDWEQARTHDPYWNAAQNQMRLTGSMHGYMRMYWGKKLLEWSETPEKAFETALYLNDKYELDGRDPNGFAGVAWCFGKHDRPWKERPVFGKVRYMNSAGLLRKFDADAYVRKVAELEGKNRKSDIRRPTLEKYRTR